MRNVNVFNQISHYNNILTNDTPVYCLIFFIIWQEKSYIKCVMKSVFRCILFFTSFFLLWEILNIKCLCEFNRICLLGDMELSYSIGVHYSNIIVLEYG